MNGDFRTLDDIRSDPAYGQAVNEQYEKEKSGPLAEGGVYVVSYQPLQALDTQEDEHELRKLLDDLPIVEKGTALQYEFIKNAILSPMEATATIVQIHSQRYTDLSTRASGRFMSLVSQLSYPFSRGIVHVTSKDPSVHPKIDFRYLSHPLDAEILARHTLQMEKVLQTQPLAQFVKEDGKRLPAEFASPVTTVDEAKAILPKYAATNYHPCGTCAMMSRELGGVVDQELKVHGVKNLRVCDASVFPIIPRGNILTTVYAVAEKGAAIILESLQ